MSNARASAVEMSMGGFYQRKLDPGGGMANCKGIAVTSRFSWVEQNHGDEALRTLLDSLEPNHRARIDERILPHAWIPIGLFINLNVNLDRQFGSGNLAMCKTLGAWAAEKNLPSLFRIFYRLGTPMFIFTKASKLWSQHYDSGRLDAKSGQPNEVRLELLRHLPRAQEVEPDPEVVDDPVPVVEAGERAEERSLARILDQSLRECPADRRRRRSRRRIPSSDW